MKCIAILTILLLGTLQIAADAALTQSDAWGNTIGSLNPVIWYRFNETSGTTAYDQSGNGYDGTYTGGFTLNQPSLIPSAVQSCVKFNGTSAYVLAPVGFSMPATPWTIIAVVSLTTIPTPNDATIAATDHPDTTHAGFRFALRNNTNAGSALRFVVANGGGASSVTAATGGGAQAGQPVLVTATIGSGTNASIYTTTNAIQSLFTSTTTAYVTSANRLYIGVDNAITSNWFNGSIQDFAVIPSALSVSQIYSLFLAFELVPVQPFYNVPGYFP